MFQVHSKVMQLYKYTYIIFEIIFFIAYLFVVRNLAFYSY